jgi:hypothetical protein
MLSSLIRVSISIYCRDLLENREVLNLEFKLRAQCSDGCLVFCDVTHVRIDTRKTVRAKTELSKWIN